MAEREFAAFISAVKELLGCRHWRAVTIAASARLANRLNADRMFGHSPKTPTNTKVSTIPSSDCFPFAPLF
jgi:hypothetical protein